MKVGDKYRWRGTVSVIQPDGTKDGQPSTCDGCRFNFSDEDGACPGEDLKAEQRIIPCASQRWILVEVV